MRPLPPVPPVCSQGWRVRLGRDYYVRAASNDYSVDPAHIDRLVDVEVGLDRVTAVCQGRVVASHARCWGRGRTVTDPAHVDQAAQLRAAFQRPGPASADDALSRDLAVYDQAFGIDPAMAGDWWQATKLAGAA